MTETSIPLWTAHGHRALPDDADPESVHQPAIEQLQSSPAFYFDGGAAAYWRTRILATLITVLTMGLGFPIALVLHDRWKARHTYIYGHRLIFTGTARGLFRHWLMWLFLIAVTLGVYGFWAVPRLAKWRTECLEFDPRD